MSYKTIVRMRQDAVLLNRIVACAAVERIENPEGFVFTNAWQFVSQPGWDSAYSYAIAQSSRVDKDSYEYGNEESVITDGMILAAVQDIWLKGDGENGDEI